MSIFSEMKQRKVFRVGAVYIVAAWLLLQVAATIDPILGLPEWFQKTVLVLLVIGFPVAVILAWAFEVTPDGVARDHRGQAATNDSRAFKYILIVAILMAGGFFVANNYFFGESAEHEVGQSIAVIPFANMSGDEGNEPFTVGIHDDLLTRLSHIRSIRTTSRTSVLQYRDTAKTVPEIATELGVATILEGGVQRSGDRVRINVQLIDARTDGPLWAETYDRKLTATNVFEIQNDIAAAIANELQATLTKEDRQRLDVIPTQSIAALDSYFIGKKLLEDRTLASLTAAVEYFEKVVDLDPDFALGWSGLADAYMLLPEHSPSIDPDMVGRRSREAVARALALDPDIPEVRSSEAWHQLIHNYDWRGAEQTFTDALTVVSDNPNVLHWLSHTLSWQGRHEEALTFARRAIEADPTSKMLRTNLAYILIDARLFDQGLVLARSERDSDPDFTVQRRQLFLHELRAGKPAAAAETFVGYADATGGDPDAARQIGDMFVAYAAGGEVGVVTDDLIARAQLGTADLAQILAFVGDAEGAIRALEVAIATRSGSRSVLSMKINPAYDFIRDDPRFVNMLVQVGLGNP